MTCPNPYPFSDLTGEQVQDLIRAARKERAQVIRSFFAALFRRRREAQVWPPKNVPALSLTAYR
jgi:hypothetical protein